VSFDIIRGGLVCLTIGNKVICVRENDMVSGSLVQQLLQIKGESKEHFKCQQVMW